MKTAVLGVSVVAVVVTVQLYVTQTSRKELFDGTSTANNLAEEVSTYGEKPLGRQAVIDNLRALRGALHTTTPVRCRDAVDVVAVELQQGLPDTARESISLAEYKTLVEKYQKRQCGARNWVAVALTMVSGLLDPDVPAAAQRDGVDSWLGDMGDITCVNDAYALDNALFVPVTGYRLAVRQFLRRQAGAGSNSNTGTCTLSTLKPFPYAAARSATSGFNPAAHDTKSSAGCSCNPVFDASGKAKPCDCDQSAVTA